MREDVEKLLIYLGRITVQIPALQLIIGYLLSDPPRVRFVASLDQGLELSMVIAAYRRIEVPMSPWQGYIRGVPVPDPLTWIQASRSLRTDMAIRLSSDDPLVLQMLNRLIAPDRERHQRVVVEDRIQNLRTELDRALDLYNEVRHLMEIDQERHDELERFLGMAESEMQNMGRELKNLKQRVDGDIPSV